MLAVIAVSCFKDYGRYQDFVLFISSVQLCRQSYYYPCIYYMWLLKTCCSELLKLIFFSRGFSTLQKYAVQLHPVVCITTLTIFRFIRSKFKFIKYIFGWLSHSAMYWIEATQGTGVSIVATNIFSKNRLQLMSAKSDILIVIQFK